MSPLVEVTIDGESLEVRRGISVAATLLNVRSGSRSWTPLCGMGICYGCKVRINGRSDQRSCLLLVDAGMTIETDAVRTGS